MKTAIVSNRFQIVIPRDLREAMDIQPGSKIQIFQYENRIELIPLQSPKDLRGYLRGIDTNVERDLD